MSTPTLFTTDAVITAARLSGLTGLDKGRPYLFDDMYVALDDAAAANWFWEVSKQACMVLKSWGNNFRDCDKFSRFVQSLGAVTHALQWKEQLFGKNGGLGIGVLNYKPDNDAERHSINTLLTKVKGKPQPLFRFFEPQTGSELFLSTTEKASADMLLL